MAMMTYSCVQKYQLSNPHFQAVRDATLLEPIPSLVVFNLTVLLDVRDLFLQYSWSSFGFKLNFLLDFIESLLNEADS